MTRVPINLPAGLKSDDTTFASQGSWRYADHMRFFKGKAEVVGGYESIAEDSIPGICRDVFPWIDNIGAQCIGLGTNSNLYVWRSGVLVDITPPDYVASQSSTQTAPGYGLGAYGAGPYGTYTGLGDYAVKTWALSNFGEALVANPRLGPIYYWGVDMGNAAVRLDSLAGADDPVNGHVPPLSTFTLVNSYRQILAFGCSQELDDTGNAPGPYNPLCIRGSDLDGNITTWAVESDNNAFEIELPNGGAIVTARMIGEQTYVWTQSGLYLGTFTGDSSTVYRFDPIAGATGAIGPNACTIVGQTAFWIAPDLNLWSVALGGAAAPILCSVQSNTFDFIDTAQGDKIQVNFLPATSEIRIDYPDTRDGIDNSRYVLFNTSDSTWSTSIEVRTALNKGSPLPHAVSATPKVVTAPYIGAMTDNTDAQRVLNTIQLNVQNYTGVNTVLRDNAIPVGNVTIVETNLQGDSGWGFTFNGNGAGDEGEGGINNCAVSAGDIVTVSLKAQVTTLEPETLQMILFHQPSDTEVIFATNASVTSLFQTYSFNNITLPTNLTDFQLGFLTGLPDGKQIKVTDIKLAVDTISSAWTPDPSDPNLFTNYGQFIRSIPFDQTVSNFYYQEFGNTADGGPISWSIETNDFAFDEDQTAMLVRGFYPDFLGQIGTVQLTVYLRMNSQDPEQVFGPYPMITGQDRVDFLGTGKMVRFKVEGNSSPASLRIGRPVFDMTPVGKR